MAKSKEEEKAWRAEYRKKNREKLREQGRRSYHKRYPEKAGVLSEQRRSRTFVLQKMAEEIKASKGCSRCPERHPACLDFHHKDRDEKESSVSMICKTGRSIQALLNEIDKCEVLCSNCHRKQHWTERTGVPIDKCIINPDAAVMALRDVEGVLKNYRKLLG